MRPVAAIPVGVAVHGELLRVYQFPMQGICKVPDYSESARQSELGARAAIPLVRDGKPSFTPSGRVTNFIAPVVLRKCVGFLIGDFRFRLSHFGPIVVALGTEAAIISWSPRPA